MRAFLSWVGMLAVGATSLGGQTAVVTSEFVRYRPDGSVVASDQTAKYRELLSPAVARNAHFTFRVTVVFPRTDGPGVRQPEGSPYTIHIAQNPENSAQIRLFLENYTDVAGELIPDALKPIEMPYGTTLANGQIAQSYLVDMFVPGESPANQRFRVEVQFHRGDGWMILPMEFRIRQARVDSAIEVAGSLPKLGSALSTILESPLRAYACGAKVAPSPQTAESGRVLLLRNLQEDLNLARQREKPDTREGVIFMLMKAASLSDLPAFCAGKASPSGGPEWWLKARDYLYQGLPVR